MTPRTVFSDVTIEVPHIEPGQRGYRIEHVPGRFVHVALGKEAPTTVCGLVTQGLHEFATYSFESIAGDLRCPDCAYSVADKEPMSSSCKDHRSRTAIDGPDSHGWVGHPVTMPSVGTMTSPPLTDDPTEDPDTEEQRPELDPEANPDLPQKDDTMATTTPEPPAPEDPTPGVTPEPGSEPEPDIDTEG